MKIVRGPTTAIFVALFSLFAVSASCARPVEASLGEAFSLSLGDRASVAGAGITVEFVAILEDSRCPKGEQCITAGNARVSIRVQIRDEAPVLVELNTARGASEASVDAFELHLENLEPYPASGKSKSASPQKSLARLLVTRI